MTVSEDAFIKRLLPRTLLGRSLMIIFTPLVVLQVVAGVIFYENHLDKVTQGLARGLAGDVATVIHLLRRFPGPDQREWIFDMGRDHMGITVKLKEKALLAPAAREPGDLLEETLSEALRDYVGRPFTIDAGTLDRHVIVRVQLPEGVLVVVSPRKRLFSSTVYVFVLWTLGTSLLLLGIATIFMRNQVKPIRRLAVAADAFGKGRDAAVIKPEGAREVRQAATAFLAMQERIKRQITQRTEMLAGVSHDLRTPLTRMKLQLALLDNAEGVEELTEDVAEMEHMVEGYLAFARGEGTETPRSTNLSALLDEAVTQARRKGGAIDFHSEGEIVATVRPNAIKRSVTNLLDNAMRYARHVSMRAGRRGDTIEILIDDDGPGIPEDKREDVFKPFFRLEKSRNPGTGGVGLGLSIARDVVRGHGGDVMLEDSPGGGLRARVRLPI